ncbi:MAG TPA: lysylphosphatidylglycerol synthase transmembrane domain-containing protein [Vicinamibacteria bacterium]|nr:lysylphosphatidylglycerol synthase transmembrane domain-containing protein [Vicinamibacteria bacterium]
MTRPLVLLIKIGVSLVLLGYLLHTTDMQALLVRVRQGDLLLLAFAVLLYVGMIVLSTWRWRTLMSAQGYDASLRDLSASYLVATFFNNFLPSNIGGDLIRVQDSSRLTGSRRTTSLAIVAVDRILGFAALYALAAAAFLLGGAAVRHLAGARVVLLGLSLLFAFLALLYFREGTARALMARSGLVRIPWARERFEVVQEAVHEYRRNFRAVLQAFGASLMLQTLFIYYYFAIARSLRIPLPLTACFLMVPLCTLVQSIPVSLNGWGIRESVFVLYFAQVGLAKDSALAFSLLGAGLVVLLSLSGAIVWTSRGRQVA